MQEVISVFLMVLGGCTLIALLWGYIEWKKAQFNSWINEKITDKVRSMTGYDWGVLNNPRREIQNLENRVMKSEVLYADLYKRYIDLKRKEKDLCQSTEKSQ